MKGYDHDSVKADAYLAARVVELALKTRPTKLRGSLGLLEINADNKPHLLDPLNLALDLERAEKMTKSVVTTTSLKYGEISKHYGDKAPWPDCDDFAGKARVQVMDYAMAKWWRYPPIFGVIEYEAINPETRKIYAHRMNWAIVIDRRGGTPKAVLRLFEPQNGKWIDDLSHITKVRKMFF